jgi:hypothetical protein
MPASSFILLKELIPGQVTDVTSIDLRCYTSETDATASTLTVNAGSTVGFQADMAMYHPGFINVYMAKAPGNVTEWDGSGTVWFKVYEIPVITDGGSTISFPATSEFHLISCFGNAHLIRIVTDIQSFTFTLPSSLPTGQYLIRAEQVGLHVASTFSGGKFHSYPQIIISSSDNDHSAILPQLWPAKCRKWW